MTKKIIVALLTLFSSLFFNANAWALTDPSILVGVEYFNGWWEQSPNKWEYGGSDWRINYPNRVPLLGEYNTQETMNKEIKAASYYGVDFFSILYYYGGNVVSQSDINQLQYLNNGLDYFINSPNAHKMKFMIELTNHQPFSLETLGDWDSCMDVFIPIMKHPSYLKVDGRAVFKIHSGYDFYVDLGSDIAKCNEVLNLLRSRALNEGVGELLITVGVSGKAIISDGHPFALMDELDATMQYMDIPDKPQQETDYAYSFLTEQAQDERNVREDDALPYVPYFPAGWNPRPWNDPRPAFSFPTREQWTSSLNKLKTDLINSTNLGFPKKDGTVQKAFTIYAWNEFGEGGIVAPTVGDQYMKLEGIREVFEAPLLGSGGAIAIYQAGKEKIKIPIDIIDSILYEHNDHSLPVDADGNVYSEVVIGTQTWLDKNLITTKYNNGDPISYITEDTKWADSASTHAMMGFYQGTKEPWGGYYNSLVALDERGVCPTGYHIPSKSEYETLVSYLGGGTIAATKLRASVNWANGLEGTNESGFNAPASSLRMTDGTYQYQNLTTFIWTSTLYDGGLKTLYTFVLDNYGNAKFQNDGLVNKGHPIRCIKD